MECFLIEQTCCIFGHVHSSLFHYVYWYVSIISCYNGLPVYCDSTLHTQHHKQVLITTVLTGINILTPPPSHGHAALDPSTFLVKQEGSSSSSSSKQGPAALGGVLQTCTGRHVLSLCEVSCYSIGPVPTRKTH